MKEEYIKERERNIFGRFKFYRRCVEAVILIKKFKPKNLPDILDVGACDAGMLKFIKDRIAFGKAVGLEENGYFISANKESDINLVKGNAEKLPFESDSFDIILASSVIEHIKNPDNFFQEFLSDPKTPRLSTDQYRPYTPNRKVYPSPHSRS